MTKYTCDICGSQIDEYHVGSNHIKTAVRFHTEQTEGRICDPYFDVVEIDVCDKCANRAVTIDAWGAMGYNSYKWRTGLTGESHD